MLIDFSNNPLPALSLVYECQECGQVKKCYVLYTLTELKLTNPIEVSQSTPKEAEPPKQEIPIERGPQIER